MATTQTREDLVQAYAAKAEKASLHTADPGTTGANELPGVTRQSLVWTAGTVDGEVISETVYFSLAAGTEITHISVWDSAGVLRDVIENLVSYTTAGIYGFKLRYVQT